MNTTEIPEEVLVEALLSRFSDKDLLGEVERREKQRLDASLAKITIAVHHYGHNVDVTSFPYWCSDDEVEING